MIGWLIPVAVILLGQYLAYRNGHRHGMQRGYREGANDAWRTLARATVAWYEHEKKTQPTKIN